MGVTMGPPVMRAIPQPTGGSSARGGACGRRRGPPPRGCTAPQPTAAKPILESIFLGPQTIDGPPAMTNMTIIAASRATEEAIEAGGHGLFTAALNDALEGGAADHMGYVTAPAIYAYVSRRFSAWDQRPVYKTNATDVLSVRTCEPLIDRL